MQNIVNEGIVAVLSWVPSAIPGSMKLLFKYGDPLPPYNRVDTSHRVFNIYHYFANHNEAELVVDIKLCASAIKELQNFIKMEKIPSNYVTEVCTGV